MSQYVVDIEGMTCGGCVNAVRNVLGKLAGVTVSEVVVGRATVTAERDVETELRKAIEKAGFSPRSVERR